MAVKSTKTKTVYLDHAAATPLDSDVLAVMKPLMRQWYGNASSLHAQGQAAEKTLQSARSLVARCIGSRPEHIVFTGSGTESDNLAIYGIAKAYKKFGQHIITTKLEHEAVLKPVADLERQGWKVTYITPNPEGIVEVEQVIQAIRPDTVLISIMYANNEIGSINPIAEIGKKLLQYRKNHNTMLPYFHTDACQAATYLDISVEKLHVDLMTVNGSKMYGPKGVGMLYIRSGVTVEPIILGGEQENGLRSGTENIAGVAGFAKAFELVQKNKSKEIKKMRILTELLWKKIQQHIPDVALHGPQIGEKRLANNLAINVAGVEGEALVLYLDAQGIMCSTGSACAAKTQKYSHVLAALGKSPAESSGSIRFSLGKENTKQDIGYVIKVLPRLVRQLRMVNTLK